jgi:hypothetical protein
MSASPLPSLYNPHSQRDDDKFIAEFVARHELLETLLRRLRTADSDSLGLHHILIGPRGMGKTSLLRRIAIAIGREPDLSARLIPLNFREEQYNVLTLGDFWRNCGESLAEWAEATGQADLARRLDQALPTEAWATDEAAAEQFKAEMKALGRRPVLLVDNLDLILDALPDESNWALRRRLQARRGPILIGASTHPLKQSADRDAAFYEFFQPDYLQPLDAQETERCMRALAASGGEHGARVVRILDAQPARLRTLHTLTAGNPRILALIYRLLGAGESDAAMADLERLLDQVTPYYKAKVEEYQTAQQRAVIDAIALNWDPVTTGDLADLTRIPSTTLSPLLIRLRKDGLIESVELSGAYAGHQLAERFLNIWYLMRHGTRRTKQKMRWLVAFLTSFYSLSDLTEIAGRAPDRANWLPEYQLAFDEALELQALHFDTDERRGAPTGTLEHSTSPGSLSSNVGMADSRSGLNASSSQTNPSPIDQTANREASSLSSLVQAAKTRVDEAGILARAGDYSAAITACDDILARFGTVPEPGLREQVARALVCKACIFGLMSDRMLASATFDEVITRFGGALESGMRAQIAIAQVLKALILSETRDRTAVIATCDDVITRFGDAMEPALREHVALALFIKANTLSEMGNRTAAIATYDDVVAQFSDALEPSLREQVAMALVNKAVNLHRTGDSAAAIATTDEVTARFGHAPEPGLRKQVAMAMFNKACTLSDIGDTAAALSTYDDITARFGDALEPGLREQVARALFNKGSALGSVGDTATATAVYDEVIDRFGDALELGLREQVARALFNKAFTVSKLGDQVAAIDTYDVVIARFADAPEPNLRELVAKALVNKVINLNEMGDRAAAIATSDDVIARFGNALEPGLREQVAKALAYKAMTFHAEGQAQKAIGIFEQLFAIPSEFSQNFAPFYFSGPPRVAFANLLLDFQGDLVRPEVLYREAAATEPLAAKLNLTWFYLLANRSSDARRELDELSNLPAVGFALLNAGIELASDNFGAATSHLTIALKSELDSAGMSFGDDLERLLRLAQHKGYGERLLAWFEQTGFADRFAPLYVAFKAYVRTDKLLLDVNPEVRGPAQIIYDRLDAPRRYAAANAPQKPKPQRPRKAVSRTRR